MFNEMWEVERFQTAIVTFMVIQGCHLIGDIRYTTSVPLQLCLYLALLT